MHGAEAARRLLGLLARGVRIEQEAQVCGLLAHQFLQLRLGQARQDRGSLRSGAEFAVEGRGELLGHHFDVRRDTLHQFLHLRPERVERALGELLARYRHADPPPLGSDPLGLLGLIHRRIGLAQQCLGFLAVERKQCQAHRHVDRGAGRATHFERSLDGAVQMAQRSAQLGQLLGVLEILQHHDELIAAEARDEVRLAQPLAQTPRDGAQQLIARIVTEPIIDRFEIIKIDHPEGE